MGTQWNTEMTLTKSLSEMQKLLQYCNKKMRKYGRYKRNYKKTGGNEDEKI